MKLLILLVVIGVAVAARPKSDCEKHRESAERTEGIVKLIPECEDNGDYKPLQCYKDHKFCVCYDKNGHAASPVSKNIKECGCYLERKRKSDSGHNNPYIPQCEADGKWVKKQCWDYNNSCWCVDEQGKQKGNVVADGSKLDCQ